MEHSLARPFHCSSQERLRPTHFWTASPLPHKLNLLSRRKRWSHISAYLKLGANDDHVTAKQNTFGFSGQAEDKWNVDDCEEMLRLMEDFEDSLPIIRTYKNDLCTLEICGSAPRVSVLTAMAADKSYFAASNLLRGQPLTIRETVLPGASGVNSTISTKLFAPSLQVVERAKKLSLPKGLSTGEFLHKFFEAVQMLHFSKVYVEIYAPGTSRNMRALDKEERSHALYSFEASSKGTLNQIGKALTLYAVFGLKRKASGKAFLNLLKMLWNKHEWIPSHTSAVRFRVLSVEEIENQAKLISDSVDSGTRKRADRLWWPAPDLALKTAKRCLDKATEDWIYEHMPMHKMHIDPEILDSQDATLPRRPEEFDLTHAQLVDLAGVFDLYYKDRFTLSNKDFQTGVMLDFYPVSRSKMAQFLELMTLGSVILGAGIFAWLVSARLRGLPNRTDGNLVLNTVDVAVISKSKLPSSGKNDESIFPVNEQLPAEEMQSFCLSVIAKLVAALAWNVEIRSHPSKGAWTENQDHERRGAQNLINAQQNVSDATKESAERSSQMKDGIKCDHTIANDSQKEKNDLSENNKEIPIFQVALSKDSTVLGFQPLNEAATYCWATMPFAKSLHNVQQLKPGFWERPLKFRRPPSDVVVLELHVDPASSYAFARPFPL